ncbi:MAG TPA: hypothetical protein VK811_02260, partial [Candidatus Acidoferrum sp.]|nr:hypothetical protein [Candidatus Acidoferrum sp.]
MKSMVDLEHCQKRCALSRDEWAGKLTRKIFPSGSNPLFNMPPMGHAKSDKLFAEALKFIPGGVNSPVRAFRAVGGNPFFVNKAKGAHVWDVDGNKLIDYVGTWGP